MIDELKTFIAVVEYKNFTKAADAINLSQPSVSLHIKHLEEYFNVTLIQRSIKQKNINITESRTREYLNLFLSTNNINAKNIIVFGSNYSVKEAVKNNLGITFISSLVTENSLRNNEISILKTSVQYTRPFSYILQKGIVPSNGALVFIDMLKKLL